MTELEKLLQEKLKQRDAEIKVLFIFVMFIWFAFMSLVILGRGVI